MSAIERPVGLDVVMEVVLCWMECIYVSRIGWKIQSLFLGSLETNGLIVDEYTFTLSYQKKKKEKKRNNGESAEHSSRFGYSNAPCKAQAGASA